MLTSPRFGMGPSWPISASPTDEGERAYRRRRESPDSPGRFTLSSVIGIYLITDTSDGRHYVGKADGHETLLQRWTSCAKTGHGGNTGLKQRDATKFRYSVLRVLDPASAEADINAVEKHYKDALDSRRHGLNEN